jgi:hypothetical protein
MAEKARDVKLGDLMRTAKSKPKKKFAKDYKEAKRACG